MYRIKASTQFKKDLKRLQKQGIDLETLKTVINTLAAGEALDPVYRDHKLFGTFAGCRECHVQPDLLLIYEITEEGLILYLTRTGTHSELFRK